MWINEWIINIIGKVQIGFDSKSIACQEIKWRGFAKCVPNLKNLVLKGVSNRQKTKQTNSGCAENNGTMLFVRFVYNAYSIGFT